METVNILGQDPDPLKIPFHLGNYLMGLVKLGLAAILFYLGKVFPGNLRMPAQCLTGQGRFYGDALFSGFIIIQPAYAPVSRQSGVSRNPRSGNKKDVLTAFKQLDNLSYIC